MATLAPDTRTRGNGAGRDAERPHLPRWAARQPLLRRCWVFSLGEGAVGSRPPSSPEWVCVLHVVIHARSLGVSSCRLRLCRGGGGGSHCLAFLGVSLVEGSAVTKKPGWDQATHQPCGVWGCSGLGQCSSSPWISAPRHQPFFLWAPQYPPGEPSPPTLIGLQMLLRLTSCRGVWGVVGRVKSRGAWTEVWGEGHGGGRPRGSGTCVDCRGGLTPRLCRRRGGSSASPLSQVSGSHSGV